MRVRREVSAVRVVWAPSLARRILRHRVAWLAAAVVVAVVGSLSIASQVAAINHARASWGVTELVPVVTDAVGIGESLTGSYVLREVPQPMVPATVMRSVRDDALAKVPLYPGEILLAGRVTNGDGGLPSGTEALTLPVLAHASLIDAGDLVDLWSVDSANLSSRRVAHRVVVLALEDDSVTVAIAREHIAPATVASLRPVTIVLVG